VVATFDKLADGVDVAEVIGRVQRACPPRGQTRPAPVAADKVDYATLDHAGKPHRGKTTDAEKEIVRNNLDKINERLERDRLRPIRLDDPEMVARYGLEDLVQEAGLFQQ
jgi:hypothetical protein